MFLWEHYFTLPRQELWRDEPGVRRAPLLPPRPYGGVDEPPRPALEEVSPAKDGGKHDPSRAVVNQLGGLGLGGGGGDAGGDLEGREINFPALTAHSKGLFSFLRVYNFGINRAKLILFSHFPVAPVGFLAGFLLQFLSRNLLPRFPTGIFIISHLVHRHVNGPLVHHRHQLWPHRGEDGEPGGGHRVRLVGRVGGRGGVVLAAADIVVVWVAQGG